MKSDAIEISLIFAHFYMPGVAKGMSRKDFFLLFFPGPFKNFLVFCHLPFDSLWFLRVPLGFLGFFIVP